MTCFHVTKFDFVSQTTRQPQSGNNKIMAIKLAFLSRYTPSHPHAQNTHIVYIPHPHRNTLTRATHTIEWAAGCVSAHSFIIDISHAFIINDKFSIYLSCRSLDSLISISPLLRSPVSRCLPCLLATHLLHFLLFFLCNFTLECLKCLIICHIVAKGFWGLYEFGARASHARLPQNTHTFCRVC